MTIETANRLYELRKKHNLSQEELAERLGVSRQAVSKWERSEASPDTDNLIALAKIYGLSLDELIYGEKVGKEDPPRSEENPSDTDCSNDADGDPIILVENGENKVRIGPASILVEDESGDKVQIGWKGLRINVNKSDDGEDNDDFDAEDDLDGEDDDGLKLILNKKGNRVKFWLEVPYAVICAALYLFFGFYNVCGGWNHSWIIFITIPIYYSLVEAIYKRKFTDFAFPVLTVFLYLYFGLYCSNWHPSWLVFFTIPIYYPIAEAIDKKLRKD